MAEISIADLGKAFWAKFLAKRKAPHSDKIHISPSEVGTWTKCGEMHRRAYIEGEKLPPGVAFLVGGGVHKGSEVNFAQKKKTKEDLPEATIIEESVTHYEARQKREGVLLNEKEEKKGADIVIGEGKDRVVRLSSLYSQQVAPPIQPRLTEEWVRVPLKRHPVDILTKIDVVNEENDIIDLKTGARKSDPREIQHSEQLTFYFVAYRHQYSQEPRSVQFRKLVDTKVPNVQELTATRGKKDIDAVANRLNAFFLAMKTGVVHPAALSAGAWWCSPMWCGYWNSCPYVNSEVKALAEARDDGNLF